MISRYLSFPICNLVFAIRTTIEINRSTRQPSLADLIICASCSTVIRESNVLLNMQTNQNLVIEMQMPV